MILNNFKGRILNVTIFFIVIIFCQNVLGKDMNILQGNVRFKLEIEGHGLKFFVNVNDITVFKQFDPDTQNNVTLPINHFMHPEKSKFSILTGPSNSGPVPIGSEVKLTLLIEDRNTNASYRLPILIFSKDYINNTKKIKDVLEVNRYHLTDNNLIESGKGEIELAVIKRDAQGHGWFEFSREVYAPNNLPLWSFFSSDNLPDYDVMTEEDRIKNIKELFKEYKKIQDALLSDDINSILPMFEQKNNEADIAFGFKPGTMEKKLRTFMQDLIDDPKAHLRIRTWEENAIFREDNKKLVGLYRAELTNMLGFMSEDGIYSSLEIKFRRQNGKWIISR